MQLLQQALLSALQESINVIMQRDSTPPLGALASRIQLDSEIFVIAVNNELLLRFASDFLEESNPNEIVLADISREITNLIIGRAKVLYEGNGKIFKLGIPEFLGDIAIENYKDAMHFRYEDLRCSLYEL